MTRTVRLERPSGESDAIVLSEIVSVRLSAGDVEALNRLVRLEDREASRIIRSAIRSYAVERLGPEIEGAA